LYLQILGGIESNVPEKTNGSNVVDGIGNSKVQEKEKPVMSKIESAKALFSKPFSSAPKPSTPTSPVTQSYFGKSDAKKEASFGSDDRKSDEEEFNSVERGERLNHLTVSRVKILPRPNLQFIEVSVIHSI